MNVYFKEDIKRILEALTSAGAMNGEGYVQALQDMALAVGIELLRPVIETWQVIETHAR